MPRATSRNAARRGGPTKAHHNDSARQAELVQIAGALFAEHGYTATTVRDIAEAAGILSGSLYHHFSSKEDMVDAILRGFLVPTLARFEEIVAAKAGTQETIEQLVRTSLAAMDEHRTAIVIYQNEATFLSSVPRFSYLQDAARRLRRMWVGVLEDGIADGVIRPGIDPTIVYRLIRDVIWSTARWYNPDGNVTTDELASQYLLAILDGIVVPSRRKRRRAAAS